MSQFRGEDLSSHGRYVAGVKTTALFKVSIMCKTQFSNGVCSLTTTSFNHRFVEVQKSLIYGTGGHSGQTTGTVEPLDEPTVVPVVAKSHT